MPSGLSSPNQAMHPLAPPRLAETYHARSGRTIGYGEYGDPAGAAVIHVHGFPSSRLEFAPNHATAARFGLRVVSPDRPGAGLSDPVASPTPEVWARDLAELTTAMGIERFALLAWSGGGPYAAACASSLRDRVVALAVVGGAPPVTGVSVHRTRERLLAWRDAAVTWQLRRIARRRPESFVSLIARTLPSCDRAVLERPDIWQNEIANVSEAFRQAAAPAVREILARNSPIFGAPLPAEVPAALWVGGLDRNVPASRARLWAPFMPHADATVHPRAGHLIFYALAEEFLGWLAAQRT